MQKTSNEQITLEKQWKWRNQPSCFRLYYKATVIKIVRYWAKERNTDQWNKIGSPEMKPHTHGHLVFDRGGINMQWRKDSLLNKQFWENRSTTLKKNEMFSNGIQTNKCKMD